MVTIFAANNESRLKTKCKIIRQLEKHISNFWNSYQPMIGRIYI